ncbi:MAG: methyltransferase domain-containing protein [bacterium]
MTMATHPDLSAADAVPIHRVLHVGCGAAHPDKLPAAFFPAAAWREVRLDIDPDVAPDIVASITGMPMVASGSVQAVWSAHNMEHLASHEVPVALAEFHRVLAPGGFVLVTMPDLQQVAELVAAGRLEEAAYMSAMGPIAALDMLYGYRPALAQGNVFMGHRTGFVACTLQAHLEQAGFQDVHVQRDGQFALWGSGVKA